MKNEEFDDFEVRVRLRDNGKWQAYLFELPQFEKEGEIPIRAVTNLWIEWKKHKKECEEQEKDIPIPISKEEFSGQFNTRVEQSLHKALVMEATARGISLNALISEKLRNSAKKINEDSEFKITHVYRMPEDSSVMLCFTNDYEKNEKVRLIFTKSNLGDELEDKIVESDEELERRFSSDPFLREAVKNFFSSQSFPHSTTGIIPLIKCLLVSHTSLSRAINGQGLNAFPKNVEDFFICKID